MVQLTTLNNTIDLISYNTEINAHITEYWKPFAPYFHCLVLATWPERIPVSSQASHKAFKDILEEALEALKLLAEVPAKYAPISQKHAQTSEIEEGRYPYPYKYLQGDNHFPECLPQPANIKQLSQ